MSKNVGPFQAFSKDWFDKHQRILIWLLNAPVIKIWFRWVMRIRQFDCPLQTKINRIEPNNFVFGGYIKDGNIYLRRDFRTHAKFAKRLYFAFKPIWWAMHYWDQFFADKYVPQWSFGFLTLTAYPDADPETTTVDGWANELNIGASWASLRGGSGTSSNDALTNGNFCYWTTNTANVSWNFIRRVISLFDTSALTSGATITAGTVSWFGDGTSSGTGGTPWDANIYASTPASNTAIANGDYAQLGATAFATAIDSAGWTTSDYNVFTLNATGLAAISKTGVTKFGARTATCDAGGTAPSGGSSGGETSKGVYYADQTGTTNDPKLVVTYTVATSSVPSASMLLLGVG